MVSIIFPTYNEESNIKELYKRICFVVSEISGHDFEFIFVDDRSTDNTFAALKTLRRSDQRVKIIRFARNCGSHAAITAGLHFCEGEVAIVMAADLQDPPGLINNLLEEWDTGKNIVWGIRLKREGEKTSTNILSRLYYFLLNKITSIEMPPKGADVFLADRIVIDEFKNIPERNTSVFMTLAWLGFDQSSIGYVKEARFSGVSKWSLRKKVKLAIDSILSFSYVPIRFMSFIGILTSLLGFLYAIFVFISYFKGNPVEGWSSLITVILVVGGIQMMMIGILGEYLWRTYDESRRRPQYTISSVMK